MQTPANGRRVTIADVAVHAGVSTAAASKVLRNAYGVSAEMTERVRASMTELGYRPHAAARSMRGRSFTIGMLLDNIHNPFYADILDGITAALATTDFQVFVGAGGFKSEKQSRMANAMIDRAMDGLILVAPSMSRTQVIATAATVPTVVVGHHDTADEYDSVVDDDLAGAALVVDHLVSLGHRRIAHTSATAKPGGWLRRPEQVRSDGYRQAMQRHGLDDHVKVVATSYSEEGGYLAGRELLDRPDRPTAIFAGADIAALGVLRAAEEFGLRIPADLSLAGYDNTTIASLAPVNLTSVDQAGLEMGATAARLLRERMDGRARSQLTSTSPRLLVRGSTASPAT
jgi:LacI family transcriptional regulator